MAPKYGSHDFPGDFGFSGSSGKTPVSAHMRAARAKGGSVNHSHLDAPGGGKSKSIRHHLSDSAGSDQATGTHHLSKSGAKTQNFAKGGFVDKDEKSERQDPPLAAGVKAKMEPKRGVPGKPPILRAMGGPATDIGDDVGGVGALGQAAATPKPPAIRGASARGRQATHMGMRKGVPSFSAKPKIGA